MYLEIQIFRYLDSYRFRDLKIQGLRDFGIQGGNKFTISKISVIKKYHNNQNSQKINYKRIRDTLAHLWADVQACYHRARQIFGPQCPPPHVSGLYQQATVSGGKMHVPASTVQDYKVQYRTVQDCTVHYSPIHTFTVQSSPVQQPVLKNALIGLQSYPILQTLCFYSKNSP